MTDKTRINGEENKCNRWYDVKPLGKFTIMEDSLRKATLKDWAIASAIAIPLLIGVGGSISYYAINSLDYFPDYKMVGTNKVDVTQEEREDFHRTLEELNGGED